VADIKAFSYRFYRPLETIVGFYCKLNANCVFSVEEVWTFFFSLKNINHRFFLVTERRNFLRVSSVRDSVPAY